MYVQYFMVDYVEILILIFDCGGRFYVCGDGSKMVLDVEVGL